MRESPDDEVQGLNALPWEISRRPIEGRAEFDPMNSRATFQRAGRYDTRSGAVAATVEAESGLTRRGLVYAYIRAHPGAHVRAMARDLRLGTGDLQYHLFWLQKHGFVKTRKDGFYRFVYPTMVFQEKQEVLLGVLSQETPREIVLFLLWNPTLTQGSLANRLGHSQPSISWHMGRLVQLGVVSKRKTSGGVVYEIMADHDDLLRFVKAYHSGVWKRWAGRFTRSVVVTAEVKRVDKKGGSAPRLGLSLQQWSN